MINFIKYQAQNLFSNDDQDDSLEFDDIIDYFKDFVKDGLQTGNRIVTKNIYIPSRFQEEPEEEQKAEQDEEETTKEEKKDEGKNTEQPAQNFDGKYYTYGRAGKYRDLGTNGRKFYQRYEFKSPVPINYTYKGKQLITMDIQELFKLEGLTTINNKKVRLNKDRKHPRTWGKNTGSYHRVIDKETGLVAAWDVSIVGGTLKDYDDLAKAMINNKNIYSWLALKGFGIFDEVRGTSMDKTGPHFHIGPDKGAQRDLYGFLKRFAPHYIKKGGVITRLIKRT